MHERVRKVSLKSRRIIFDEEVRLSEEIKSIRAETEASIRDAEEQQVEDDLLVDLGKSFYFETLYLN
jgi:hypothetical protein